MTFPAMMSNQASAPLSRLRALTREPHEALHSHPLLTPLMESQVSRAELSHAVMAFYGFHLALAQASRGRLEAFGIGASPHLERLEADLRSLGFDGHSLSALPSCPPLPPMRDDAERLGALYVTEGSTLGGQLMARQLGTALGTGPEGGYRYFAGDGPKETGRRWKVFLDRLAKVDERTAEAAADYAAMLFARLSDWLSISCRKQ